MTARNIVQRWDVANAKWTCASCHGWQRDHLETGQCLFAPGSFRSMTADEFIEWRETQAEEFTVTGVDQFGDDVSFTHWKPR